MIRLRPNKLVGRQYGTYSVMVPGDTCMPEDSPREDDLWWYVEYLQRDLVPERPRTWVTHEEYLTWVQANRGSVGRSIPAEHRAQHVEQLERNLVAFNPSTPFEDYHADTLL